MSCRKLVASLASYVPGALARRIAADPRPPTEPLAEKLSGATLVADVSGFTVLTERLAQRGAIGAEVLHRTLNEFFGRMITLIGWHGGDVVRFAGDALLAAWYEQPGDDPARATERAAHCALALQAGLHDYETSEGLRLSVKIGIGAGQFVVVRLGGVLDRWEFLVSGPAFVQSLTALEKAAPGQAAVSLRAWSYLQDHFTGRQLPMGSVLLESEESVPDLPEPQPQPLTDEMAAALQAYIPGPVVSRLLSGYEDWLGELRVVSVLFVSLPELNYATPLARAQQIVRYLQGELYRFEGSVNKLNLDDKGTSLLAAMGLPPLSHDDDAKRAVQAAKAMQNKLGELGLCSSIGVATGRAFCGSIGNSSRREYTMMGDVVNLAARLMQAALGDVFCDEATYHMAQGRIEFERLPDVMIKGKGGPVTVYRPVGRPCRLLFSKAELVGRRRERELLGQRLRGVAAGAETSVVILEGDAGIGKSRLVGDCLEAARRLGVNSLVGWGDSIEATTLYYAWRAIVAQLLGLDNVPPDPKARREHLLARLADHPDLLRVAPLLESVVPCGLEDNEITAGMSGQVRGVNTRDLVVKLLETAAARSPTVLVLEDAHWQDSASWALVALAVRKVPSILVLLVTRPFTQVSPEEYGRILRSPGTVHVELARLSLADTAELAAHCLEADSVPEPITALIHEKAEGNPLFAEELAYALRDGGLIEVSGRQCRLAADSLNLEHLGLPDTLHGVVASRIDRLGAPEQLAVKIASVIGRLFRFRALYDNYPVERDKPRLRDHLASAQRADIIGMAAGESGAAYRFRHVILQQVAYELLPFSQREQLHRAIARWYERSYAADLAQHYAVLAYHWRHAKEPAKAVDYLEKAGETALRSGGYSEAAGFFSEALGLDQEAGLATTPYRRGRWERQLGEAHQGLGKLPESRTHLERALALFGHPAPATRTALAVGLVRHGVPQLVRRALPLLRRRRARREQTDPVLTETARAYERLAEILYLSSNRVHLLHALLATVNVTEKAGPSPELVRAYANNCFAAALLGMHRLAEGYARDGLAIAREIGDPSATAWVLEVTGVYALGMGRIAEAQERLREAIALARDLGDWQHWGESMAVAAQAAYCRGALREGLGLWTDVYTTARNRGDRLQQAWGLNGQAEGLLKLGEEDHAEQAVALLRTALDSFTENIDRVSRMTTYGLLALAHADRGDRAAAEQAADAGMELVDGGSAPTGYYTLGGYAGVCRVYLGLWEAAAGEDRGRLARRARRACRALDRYQATFPLGLPSALLCRGMAARLRGREHRAAKAWDKGLQAARRLGMPYEAALVHYEIGRHLAAGAPGRQRHLARARELFESMEAGYDAARVRRLAE